MKHIYQLALFFIFSSVLCTVAWAKHESSHPLSNDDWKVVEKNMALIDSMNYMPTLLPLIMRNKDALQLTKKQIENFRGWRKKNYVLMVNTMNDIVDSRIVFKKAALDVNTQSEELYRLQEKSLDLQRKLLTIKLSCRKILIDNFTKEQWDNFRFVVSDNPKLAAFFN